MVERHETAVIKAYVQFVQLRLNVAVPAFLTVHVGKQHLLNDAYDAQAVGIKCRAEGHVVHLERLPVCLVVHIFAVMAESRGAAVRHELFKSIGTAVEGKNDLARDLGIY